MTNKNVNVSIKIPCSENFDNFVNTDKGGYCSSCKKNVIDFRLKSDEELKAILNKPSNKVCGYFDKSQLKIYNYNNISIKKQYSNNLINTGILSFSLLSVNDVFYQKNK